MAFLFYSVVGHW